MKTRILILLSLLVMGIALVSAQEAESFDPADKGYITMPVLAGTLTDNGDGTYSLMVEELAPLTTVLVQNDDGVLGAGNFPTVRLIDAFRDGTTETANTLSFAAVLLVDGATMDVTVTGGSYEADAAADASEVSPYSNIARNATFVLTVENATNLENGKDLASSDFPTDIANGSLTLTLDGTTLGNFSSNLQNIGRLGGADTGCMNCGK
jgi:hypothetical protein